MTKKLAFQPIVWFYRFRNDKVAAGGYRQVKVLEFFDCSSSQKGVEDLRELLHKVSNVDTAVAQRRLEDKQPEEKTNTDWLVKEQKKEYQTGWKIKTGNVLDSCNKRSTQQCIKSVVAKHLDVARIQQQNRLVDETNVTLFAKLAHDRDQQLACELFGYREDSNEAAFVVAVVEKIYAHESLTFNIAVSCEVISKSNDRLKDDMDAWSDVYVLNNGCRNRSDDSDGYYLKYTPEGSLSEDCDVEKNDKWSCIYATGSQECHMVCTRLDIASAEVGSLKANLQHMEALSTTEAGYMTFNEAWKKEIWLKRLLTLSGYELRLVAGIATGALVRGSSLFEVPALVKVAAYRY
nr:zinc finger, CCHC-type [Tanacetum cinerariifolium]